MRRTDGWISAFRNSIIHEIFFEFLQSLRGSHRSCLVTLSLDTVEDIMIEEIDELEEDVIWSISYLEDVMDIYVHELEGVLDSSGITIDTKFSALYFLHVSFLHQRSLHTRRLGILASPSSSVLDMSWGLHLPDPPMMYTLITCMYFKGIGNDSSYDTYSLTLDSRWWR